MITESPQNRLDLIHQVHKHLINYCVEQSRKNARNPWSVLYDAGDIYACIAGYENKRPYSNKNLIIRVLRKEPALLNSIKQYIKGL